MRPGVPDRRAALLALLGGGLGASGFVTRQDLTATQQKLLAAHFTNNDPVWALLAKAAVTEDREKGLLKAAFPRSFRRCGASR